MRRNQLARWEAYFLHRNNGLGVAEAARRARLDRATAHRFEKNDPTSTGIDAAATLGITSVAGNLIAQPLNPDARKALDDFAYFRRRYFGRQSTPWQERAAYEILRRLETGDREYVVMNEPPGSGKSTLFTHDIPCWLITRDRTIRIQIGSRTERQARMYVGRIKRSLERDAPLRADADSLALGIAHDAHACLADDYGAFKPEGRTDLWRANELVVRQTDGVALDDKESTVSAWGMDSGFLGGRFDVVIWDDLVDRKNTKTLETADTLRDWYDTEAETRLEPGGLMLLQGQRIQHNDLYRYCLDKKTLDERPKYAHVVYKAHYDELCTGSHDTPNQQPWPNGCLLDPHRLPWKFLETVAHNNPRTYAVMYQQEDGDIVGSLIDPAWISGGTDNDGYHSPGCLDRDRNINEPPPHLADGNGWSFVTVDPSPTEWWGIIWWLYDPDTNRRYVIDIIRRRLNPEQFLSLDLDSMQFTGLMVDLRERSHHLHIPIRHVIVEVNAAQRWLLSQPHVQRWSADTGIVFVPHTTTINKQDPKFGFESIGDLFRQGHIRLPWAGPASRAKVNDLIREATTYPEAETDDLLMSVWFSKLAVERHWTPTTRGNALYQMDRPDWIAPRRGRDIPRGLTYA